MKKFIAGLAVVLVSVSAMAQTKPINLSLTPDIAICDKTDVIEGLTLSIWGENEQTSLALGFVNGTTGNSAGLSWAWILNYADNYTGIQWAMINYTKSDFKGWQGGWVNYAGRLTGLQLGLVNFAEATDTGLQIGLLNVIRDNAEWFSKLPEELAPAMIFVNWRF